MDFAQVYTEEQERFRQEVRTWLEENVPDEMKEPIDLLDYTEEQFWFWRGLHKELGKKGWLYPTYPKEYGGGGLTGDHEAIIAEEFTRARAPRSFSRDLVNDTLLVWGTEEQKQKFLRPFLTGEKITWQKLTEPQSGADLANVTSRAVRDGDDWILNGQNVFIGDTWGPDFISGLMMTDPDAPRHRNLGYFVIPVPSAGLTMRHMSLITGNGAGGKKNAIFLENVRVPGDNLIGGDHQGWQVMSTHLEFEHGGGGRAFPLDEQMENLLEYVKDTKQDRESLGSDPVVQQAAMDVFIRSHVQELMLKRTYWMYQNRSQIQSEGNTANVHGRLSKDYIKVREVMGMYSLLGTKDPRAPHGGFQEVRQRAEAGQHHGGGSTNIAKVILARRIGVSRTQERAAPTPSTTSTGAA
jgi:alkylation response protein AidB-like acyl-CoA dehydrogenase